MSPEDDFDRILEWDISNPVALPPSNFNQDSEMVSTPIFSPLDNRIRTEPNAPDMDFLSSMSQKVFDPPWLMLQVRLPLAKFLTNGHRNQPEYLRLIPGRL